MAYSENKPYIEFIERKRMPSFGGPNVSSLVSELTGLKAQPNTPLGLVVIDLQHEPDDRMPYPSGIICVPSDAGEGGFESVIYIPDGTFTKRDRHASNSVDEIVMGFKAAGYNFFIGTRFADIARAQPGKVISQSLAEFEESRYAYIADFVNRTDIPGEYALRIEGLVSPEEILAGLRIDIEPLATGKTPIYRRDWDIVGLTQNSGYTNDREVRQNQMYRHAA